MSLEDTMPKELPSPIQAAQQNAQPLAQVHIPHIASNEKPTQSQASSQPIQQGQPTAPNAQVQPTSPATVQPTGQPSQVTNDARDGNDSLFKSDEQVQRDASALTAPTSDSASTGATGFLGQSLNEIAGQVPDYNGMGNASAQRPLNFDPSQVGLPQQDALNAQADKKQESSLFNTIANGVDDASRNAEFYPTTYHGSYADMASRSLSDQANLNQGIIDNYARNQAAQAIVAAQQTPPQNRTDPNQYHPDSTSNPFEQFKNWLGFGDNPQSAPFDPLKNQWGQAGHGVGGAIMYGLGLVVQNAPAAILGDIKNARDRVVNTLPSPLQTVLNWNPVTNIFQPLEHFVQPVTDFLHGQAAKAQSVAETSPDLFSPLRAIISSAGAIDNAVAAIPHFLANANIVRNTDDKTKPLHIVQALRGAQYSNTYDEATRKRTSSPIGIGGTDDRVPFFLDPGHLVGTALDIFALPKAGLGLIKLTAKVASITEATRVARVTSTIAKVTEFAVDPLQPIISPVLNKVAGLLPGGFKQGVADFYNNPLRLPGVGARPVEGGGFVAHGNGETKPVPTVDLGNATIEKPPSASEPFTFTGGALENKTTVTPLKPKVPTPTPTPTPSPSPSIDYAGEVAQQIVRDKEATVAEMFRKAGLPDDGSSAGHNFNGFFGGSDGKLDSWANDVDFIKKGVASDGKFPEQLRKTLAGQVWDSLPGRGIPQTDENLDKLLYSVYVKDKNGSSRAKALQTLNDVFDLSHKPTPAVEVKVSPAPSYDVPISSQSYKEGGYFKLGDVQPTSVFNAGSEPRGNTAFNTNETERIHQMMRDQGLVIPTPLESKHTISLPNGVEPVVQIPDTLVKLPSVNVDAITSTPGLRMASEESQVLGVLREGNAIQPLPSDPTAIVEPSLVERGNSLAVIRDSLEETRIGNPSVNRADIQEGVKLPSEDTSLDELYAQADSIGNKYQTPEEIASHNEALSKVGNEVDNTIEQQFPDNAGTATSEPSTTRQPLPNAPKGYKTNSSLSKKEEMLAKMEAYKASKLTPQERVQIATDKVQTEVPQHNTSFDAETIAHVKEQLPLVPTRVFSGDMTLAEYAQQLSQHIEGTQVNPQNLVQKARTLDQLGAIARYIPGEDGLPLVSQTVKEPFKTWKQVNEMVAKMSDPSYRRIFDRYGEPIPQDVLDGIGFRVTKRSEGLDGSPPVEGVVQNTASQLQPPPMKTWTDPSFIEKKLEPKGDSFTRASWSQELESQRDLYQVELQKEVAKGEQANAQSIEDLQANIDRINGQKEHPDVVSDPRALRALQRDVLPPTHVGKSDRVVQATQDWVDKSVAVSNDADHYKQAQQRQQTIQVALEDSTQKTLALPDVGRKQENAFPLAESIRNATSSVVEGGQPIKYNPDYLQELLTTPKQKLSDEMWARSDALTNRVIPEAKAAEDVAKDLGIDVHATRDINVTNGGHGSAWFDEGQLHNTYNSDFDRLLNTVHELTHFYEGSRYGSLTNGHISTEIVAETVSSLVMQKILPEETSLIRAKWGKFMEAIPRLYKDNIGITLFNSGSVQKYVTKNEGIIKNIANDILTRIENKVHAQPLVDTINKGTMAVGTNDQGVIDSLHKNSLVEQYKQTLRELGDATVDHEYAKTPGEQSQKQALVDSLTEQQKQLQLELGKLEGVQMARGQTTPSVRLESNFEVARNDAMANTGRNHPDPTRLNNNGTVVEVKPDVSQPVEGNALLTEDVRERMLNAMESTFDVGDPMERKALKRIKSVLHNDKSSYNDVVNAFSAYTAQTGLTSESYASNFQRYLKGELTHGGYDSIAHANPDGTTSLELLDSSKQLPIHSQEMPQVSPLEQAGARYNTDSTRASNNPYDVYAQVDHQESATQLLARISQDSAANTASAERDLLQSTHEALDAYDNLGLEASHERAQKQVHIQQDAQDHFDALDRHLNTTSKNPCDI